MEIVSLSTGEVKNINAFLRELNPIDEMSFYFDFKVETRKIKLSDFKGDWFRIGPKVIDKEDWFMEYETYIHSLVVEKITYLKEHCEIALDGDYWKRA